MSPDTPKPGYEPGAFDLARDAAPGLPVTLVERWRAGGRTVADARRLLGEHVTTGYAVVSDSAGLTKMSRTLGLLEVLALIDGPKRLLHAYGTAAGGRAVGVWAADNAQMFHPASTGADVLLSALLRTQDEIARRCRVRIGVGVHHGNFYDLDGGLHGAEAEAVEILAENHTEGGEIAVTEAVAERLPAGHSFVLRRKDVPGVPGGPLRAVYRVLDGPRAAAEAVPDDGERYPIPYSAAFYEDLLGLERDPENAGLAATLAERHLRERTVVLAERGEAEAGDRGVVAESVTQSVTQSVDGSAAGTGDGDGGSEAAILRELDLSVAMRETGLRLLPPVGTVEIKVAGRLGIYLFDEPTAAARFARDLRAALAEAGMTCRIGVDTGPVLAGPTPGGGWDVAGAPVNLASKMAQDLAAPGLVCLSEAVGAHAGPDGFTLVRHTVSGVDMAFYQG
ncbi:family 3 adenylate cyclase [Microbispora cellulosiformans]|uniref:Family 3 adenylate cyclase n=1 Tax=Microbispora cellulosiformans TaxID=2614688 RepID=A0A5J5K3D6_9ACTN|nr:family 3 adenylate cyclase [Microbispora cellulosiformans]KAA9377640.1 family 3 adenylate cyclase [Microbispora cellulosiformans]